MRINITVIFTLTFRSEACALVSLGSRRALSHKTNTCLSFIVYPSCRSFLLHRKHSRHRQLHQWPWMAQKHSFPQDGMGIYSTSLYTGNMTRFVGPVLLFFVLYWPILPGARSSAESTAGRMDWMSFWDWWIQDVNKADSMMVVFSGNPFVSKQRIYCILVCFPRY